MPRVSRSTGPVRANAVIEYATDASTLNATSPFTSDEPFRLTLGSRVRMISFPNCCTQNPAESITNSCRGGSVLSWVIAKNGIP